MTDKQLVSVQAVIIILLLVIAYHEVRNHYFVWDTIPFVLDNPWIHEWTFDNIAAMFTQAHRANWHPVVLLSHALDFTLFGDDAGLHHLTNLALHIVNALLLYVLISRIILRTGQPASLAAWTGFLTALIFGLHPQHVESVAWVVERKDVLYSVFALTSLILYLKYAGREDNRYASLIWPFVFFCIAIATKPMAVTLPVVLMLLDIYPLNRCRNPFDLVRLSLEKIHYFLVAAAVVAVTLSTQSIAMPDTLDLPLWSRVLNAIDNTLFYFLGYVWPLDLSPFYPYPQDANYLQSAAFWLPGVLFLLITSVSTIWMLYRDIPWPFLLFAFYLVTLSPVSGLVHVGPAKATDHYVYLATIPFSLLTALALVWAWQNAALTRLLSVSLGTFYMVFLLSMTQLQVTYWNNPLTLWSRVAALYPQSPFGHRNLAAAHVQIGDLQRALHHAELSLRLGSPDIEYVEKLRAHVEQQ